VTDLIDTTEMYLRTVFELEEEGILPLRARIAERLGHSGPTVSQTVARMERDGLLTLAGDRHIELTPDGRQKATRVMRKHRLAERLLTDVIGLDWAYVHDEACRWEHVMSERVERRLVELLGGPTESPYGNPIPGLAELGGDDVDAASFRTGVVALTDAVPPSPTGHEVGLRVRRFGEPLQTDTALMQRLHEAGIRPGADVTAVRQPSGPGLHVRGSDGAVDLTPARAHHVFVALAAAS